MPINVGYIEGTAASGGLVVRVYYDATFTPVGATQPLIDGPRGFCLDVTNTSGVAQRVNVTGPTGSITANVGQGNPVTAGNARSRTAAQMAALGFTTRGDVQDFQVG
jgi:hypothetical protein